MTRKGSNFIKGAIKHPGALHRELGVPEGQKIPESKIKEAAKKGGKLGQRARFAETLEKLRPKGNHMTKKHEKHEGRNEAKHHEHEKRHHEPRRHHEKQDHPHAHEHIAAAQHAMRKAHGHHKY